MLYKSGVNLKSGVIRFIKNNKEITLFSAYLKLDELKAINESKKIKRIVVRWEIKDLCLKVSDLELYQYCVENKITLYRNTRIHLKAFWNDAQNVFFGSANVTGRGLGERGDYNYELNGSYRTLSFTDVAYFNKIILMSEYVSESLFLKIKNLVEQTQITMDYPSLKTNKNQTNNFLISNLPMSESVEILFKGYKNPDELKVEDFNFIAHDMALYEIPQDLDYNSFHTYLKSVFNAHPFILKLKEYIKNTPDQSLRYGGVVRWIQDNTTTVPTPRSWEIKRDVIVNILYSWICDLDDDFKWSAPNYSQVIYYRQSKNRLNMKKEQQWLSSKEMKAYLNISDCKLMHLREEGELEYKKRGDLYFYKIE